MSTSTTLPIPTLPHLSGFAKLQSIIRRKQSGSFNRIQRCPSWDNICSGTCEACDDHPSLYITNMAGATRHSPSLASSHGSEGNILQDLYIGSFLRDRNIRVIVSAISYGRCSDNTADDIQELITSIPPTQEDIMWMVSRCPSIAPFGTCFSSDMDAQSCRLAGDISPGVQLCPYPVYYGICGRLREMDINNWTSLVLFHERALHSARVNVREGSPMVVHVPIYIIHVPVEDNHTTVLSSFMPELICILEIATGEVASQESAKCPFLFSDFHQNMERFTREQHSGEDCVNNTLIAETQGLLHTNQHFLRSLFSYSSSRDTSPSTPLIGLSRTPISVLVHCLQGVSRSPSIIICYLLMCAGAIKRLRHDLYPTSSHKMEDSGDDGKCPYLRCLEALLAVRPCVDPNPFFRAEMKRIERRIWCNVPK